VPAEIAKKAKRLSEETAIDMLGGWAKLHNQLALERMAASKVTNSRRRSA